MKLQNFPVHGYGEYYADWNESVREGHRYCNHLQGTKIHSKELMPKECRNSLTKLRFCLHLIHKTFREPTDYCGRWHLIGVDLGRPEVLSLKTPNYNF